MEYLIGSCLVGDRAEDQVIQSVSVTIIFIGLSWIRGNT